MDYKNTIRSKLTFVLRIAAFLVIVAAVFLTGVAFGKNQVVCRACKPESVDFSLFWNAYNILGETFIDKEKINDQDVVYGAIAGMTKKLGDPYTEFFEPSKAKIFSQDLSGSFSGIGVEIGIRNGNLTVIAPLKGTPGDKAGLKSGDIILKVDGKITDGMSIDEAVSIIRGKKGVSVVLTVFRDGWKDVKDISIIRDTIKIESMSWEIKDGNIAYVAIHHFNQQLPQDFKKAAFEILASSAEKIIIDLRNNPGGYLDVCQQIAGWFLTSGQVVTIEDFGLGRSRQEYIAEGNGTFAKYPVVIIMNGGSASASEILAGALRDNRGVKIIGEKSFGKGSVQEVIDLQDGNSFMKITVAKWLTPSGHLIAEVGLVPDIKVEVDNDTSEKDLQLQKALEIIKGLK
jgi:carboxyl-terminal processing protease